MAFWSHFKFAFFSGPVQFRHRRQLACKNVSRFISASTYKAIKQSPLSRAKALLIVSVKCNESVWRTIRTPQWKGFCGKWGMCVCTRIENRCSFRLGRYSNISLKPWLCCDGKWWSFNVGHFQLSFFSYLLGVSRVPLLNLTRIPWHGFLSLQLLARTHTFGLRTDTQCHCVLAWL